VIRALIADDEALSRRLVCQLLERHADVAVVAECADGVEAREAIAQHDPDVVFLDIRMPLETGLEVARGRSSLSGPLVVFVTAFERFALPAFEADAVDYLTKPLTEERFDSTLERVRHRLHLRRSAERLEALSRDEKRPSYLQHFVTRIAQRNVIIPVDSVDYIEADDVYAAVVAQGKRHLVRSSLDHIEQRLDPSAFARIHRRFIVRLDRVAELRRARSGGDQIVLSGGVTLPLSRRRRASLSPILKPLAT
jgi:two-component system LytT family response regulator